MCRYEGISHVEVKYRHICTGRGRGNTEVPYINGQMQNDASWDKVRAYHACHLGECLL